MPSPNFRCFLAVALVGLALALGASAVEVDLQGMDVDRDGMISAAEYAAGARQRFQQMDVDRNGRVTAPEMGTTAAGHEAGSPGTCSPLWTPTVAPACPWSRCGPVERSCRPNSVIERL